VIELSKKIQQAVQDAKDTPVRRARSVERLMNVRRGDIAIGDVPYSEQASCKGHPALVVQADEWNQRLDTTLLAGITSQYRKVEAPTQYFINVATTEGQQTGLHFNSVVQCEKLSPPIKFEFGV